MASVKIASHAPFPFENTPNVAQDDSFASYLTLIKENFPLELTNTRPERLSCQISTSSRRKAPDGELDVFGAEKYFSGQMDNPTDQIPESTITTITRTSSPKKDTGTINVIARTKSRSASVSSETTSAGNSQSALLCDHRRRSPPKAQMEANSKKFLGLFRCSSCSNKTSVKTNNKESNLNTNPKKIESPEHKHHIWGTEELNLRDLRIQRLSPTLKDEAIPFSLKRSPTPSQTTTNIFNDYKVIENIESIPPTRRERKSFNIDEDIGSESSSDLFEIESISTTSHQYLRQDSAATPSAGYAPSEASIEWSVATASAANFDDGAHQQYRGPGGLGTGHRPGFLLGCVSQKAVSVGEAVQRRTEMPAMSAVRYRAESCGVVYLGPAGGAGAVGRAGRFGYS